MPLIKCCDCGTGRRIKRNNSRAIRCKPCQREAGIRATALRRETFKRKKLCRRCGDKLSPYSIAFCEVCAAYHAGYQAVGMRQKRAANPSYRADEREKVRARMRTIRAKRREAGLNNRGAALATAADVKNSATNHAKWAGA